MKIFHFLPWFTRDYAGGTEQFLFNLAKLQVDAGDEVEVLQPNDKEADESIYHQDIRVYLFASPQPPLNSDYYSGRSTVHRFLSFREYLTAHKPDVIHFHGTEARLIYQHAIILELGIPAVVTTHLIGFSCIDSTLSRKGSLECDGRIYVNRCTNCILYKKYPALSSIAGPILSQAFERLPKSVTYNNRFLQLPSAISCKKSFISFLAKQQDIAFDSLNDWYGDVLEQNGVPAKKISRYLNQYNNPANYSAIGRTPAHSLKLIFIGRVSHAKGVGTLISAIEKLADFKAHISLVFAGDIIDNALYDQAMVLKQQAGVDIRFSGRIPNSQLLKEMKNFDYLIFPSVVNEMLPLSIQEALNTNLPVIAAASQATRSLILPGINGHLFRMGDSNDLMQVLRGLLESQYKLSFQYNGKDDWYNYYNALYRQMIHKHNP